VAGAAESKQGLTHDCAILDSAYYARDHSNNELIIEECYVLNAPACNCDGVGLLCERFWGDEY
jgi:hypothetical protein